MSGVSMFPLDKNQSGEKRLAGISAQKGLLVYLPLFCREEG